MPRIALFVMLLTQVVCVGLARADIPPPGGETCTVEEQQHSGETCVTCSANHSEPNACSAQYAGQPYSFRCRTSGATVWTELWCKPGGITKKSSCQSTGVGVWGLVVAVLALRRRRWLPALPALLLGCSHSDPNAWKAQAASISSEPAPQGPVLGDTLCIAGAAHYETLMNPAKLADEITEFQALGVKQIRYDVDWTVVEKTKGTYDLDWLEQPLSMLEKAGIRSIPMLGYGHPFYNGRTDGDPKYPTDPPPFAAYAGALARRFGTRLGPYEIWNEPNAGYRFFKPNQDPEKYGEILVAARNAIKEACPACQVIFGGVFWHHEVIVTGGVDFIKATYAAQPSLTTLLDGLAVHPYAFYPPTAAPDSHESPDVPFLDMMSEAVAATGVATAPPTWITEVGWPIQDQTVDEGTQAAHLVKMFALSSKARSQATCWYDLMDGPNAGHFPPEDDFGLLHYDMNGPTHALPKRAFLAYQAVAKLLGPLSYSRDRGTECGLTADGDTALLFRDAAGAHAATVLWSTNAADGATAKVPLHRDGSPALYDDAGKPLPLSAQNGVAVVPVGVEPVLLVE